MSTGFVRRFGKDIHDISNNPFLLRGVGIGGWLLLEGYMVMSYNEIDRPRRFFTHIENIIGTEQTKAFFERWYRLFFTEEDVKKIKSFGFNSIRIPLDYQFLYQPSETDIELEAITDHFDILDKIIHACNKHQIYVILDMHAAPGGQTGTNIDNSENNEPELFLNPIYQDQLCYIWNDIAKRYKEEPYIAAYDLLNEPLPKWFSQYNDQLIPLYERVIKAIRSVDSNHMITLEGLHWSTDWSCFTKLLDDNILLQFHKYWSNPDQESIKDYLDMRDQLQVPIFMGEGGENNLEWYASVFTMYEQLGISYNFWTYKKMDTHNSIVSIQPPPQWKDFFEQRLSMSDAIILLNRLLRNISFPYVTWNPSCVNHILRTNRFNLPAYAYDYVKGSSFHNEHKYDSSLRKTDQFLFTNSNGKPIDPSFQYYNGEDVKEEDKIHLLLHKNEWVCYSVHISSLTIDNIQVISSNNKNITIDITSNSSTTIIKLRSLQDVFIKEIQIDPNKTNNISHSEE